MGCGKLLSPLLRVYFLCLFLAAPQGGQTVRQTEGGSQNRSLEVPRMTVKITLACTECKQRNYDKKKNKKNNPDRLEMKKYCRFCKKHTVHRETK